MRHRNLAVLLGAAALVSACQSEGTATLETEDQKASYAIGLDMGRSLAPAEGRLDMAAFTQGLKDAMAGEEPRIAQEELQAAVQALGAAIQEEQQRERAELGEKNRSEGAAYLAENGARDGVTTTESGLQYEVLEAGDGPMPAAEDMVTLHYRGTFIDGTEFDSSYERGEPATFGVGGVIPGFSEALQLMPVGSKYRVVIPSELAYGPQGQGEIGPDATLVFEIELLSIN